MSLSESAIRLLVVEDSSADVRLLQLALEEASSLAFSLTQVDALGAALDLLRAGHSFDAALLDLGLPDSQGLETLASIVAAAPELPVIVFTSLDDEDLGLQAMQSGAEDYLAKGRPSGKEIARTIRYSMERKRLRLELRCARDEALESARLKSAFLANMSHEIRTPLNIITGFSGMIEDRACETQDHILIEDVQCVKRACARLLETVNGILDLSKIEAGSFQLNPKPIDVGRMLERLAQEFRPLAESKGLALALAIEDNAELLFDDYCLVHALQNLLQNAVKFTKRGGIELRLRRAADGLLRIEVSDTGVGIGEAFLPRLFDSFSQEHNGYAREFEGSGLGLALTRRFLSLNGATISVESQLTKGSTFTIGFPARSERASMQALPKSPRVSANQFVSTRTPARAY